LTATKKQILPNNKNEKLILKGYKWFAHFSMSFILQIPLLMTISFLIIGKDIFSEKEQIISIIIGCLISVIGLISFSLQKRELVLLKVKSDIDNSKMKLILMKFGENRNWTLIKNTDSEIVFHTSFEMFKKHSVERVTIFLQDEFIYLNSINHLDRYFSIFQNQYNKSNVEELRIYISSLN